jgi:hypothetical protein
MTRLTDIIEIQISRETSAVAQTNFNVPAFISAHTNFVERARVYSSLLAVGDDFASTDTAYIAAQKFFGQAIKPANVVIGRRQIPGATVNVVTVAAATTYTLTVSGQVITYVSQALDTAILIATGLKTAYDVTPVTGVTVTDNLDGTLTIASTVDWSLKVSLNLSKSNAPAVESWSASVNAVQNENDTWYALAIESHNELDVLEVAGVIEAKKKIFGTSSGDTDIKTTGTTDVFSQLQALGYQRTFGMYSALADTQFPECAWIGFQLQEQPGSNTWAYKALTGVTVSKLSDTESTNIKAKAGNTYESVGGQSVTVGGKMFGGEFIDIMVFVDWLEARMTERLWFRMANSKKIPYTAAGATIIESEIRAQLNDGIRVGGLADSPSPVVRVPDVLSVAPNLRAQRIFEGIEFEARLAGAIHFVKIRGTVTV